MMATAARPGLYRCLTRQQRWSSRWNSPTPFPLRSTMGAILTPSPTTAAAAAAAAATAGHDVFELDGHHGSVGGCSQTQLAAQLLLRGGCEPRWRMTITSFALVQSLRTLSPRQLGHSSGMLSPCAPSSEVLPLRPSSSHVPQLMLLLCGGLGNGFGNGQGRRRQQFALEPLS